MTPLQPDASQRAMATDLGVDHVAALLEAAGQAGRYQGVTQIGAGGIGVVYRATDTRLNRAVAIKAIHTARLADPRTLSRLRAEALAAASLDHPYICKIYELIETRGEQLIVMEFVEGETLADILSRGIPPLATTLRLAIEIAEGLANAHERGLVHRDLKPNNVMVTTHGHIKLLDFGLAQVEGTATPDADTHTPPPVSDAYAGTPHYMAPEQAAGRAVTVRTDVFSLGVVLFRCLTGRLPFEGSTLYGYTSSLLSKDPTPLHRLAPDTPADLARLIDRCLEKSPSLRPDSASAVVIELRKQLDALSSATGAGISVRARRRRNMGVLIGMGVGLTAIMIVSWRWSASRDLDDVVWQSRALTTSSSEESTSRVSPDGQWISYLSKAAGETEIMVRRLDGGEARQVAIAGGVPLAQLWSPQGDKLAYLTRQGAETFLQIVPAFFGGPPERSIALTPSPAAGSVRLSRWIGQTIYLDLRSGRGRTLRSVNLADGSYDSVSERWKLAGTIGGVDVSPDGRRVAYTLSDGTQNDLWVASLDGTGAKRLTNDQAFELYPIWSGGGRSVIYQSNRGGQTDLWEVGVASARSRQLTSSPTVEEPESTSADGRLVTFNQASESSHLWLFGPGSKTSSQLTDDALGDLSPAAGGGSVVFQRSPPSSMAGNPLTNSVLFLGRLDKSRFLTPAGPIVEGFAARLSADGSKLAYLQRGADPQRATLMVRDLKTSETVQVSAMCPRPGYAPAYLDWLDQNLAWNAAGTELYYVDRPDAYQLRRYRPGAPVEPPLATAGPRELIQDVHVSADGVALAYVVASQKTAVLHVVDARTGAEQAAVSLEGEIGARGWLAGEASVVAIRRLKVWEDGTSDVEVLDVSMRGAVRRVGALERVIFQTIRLDRARDVIYLVRADDGADNLYEYSLAMRSLRKISDNLLSSVSYSGIEALRQGAVLAVRKESRSDVWLLDAGAPPAR